MRLTLTKQAEYALRALIWLSQEDEAAGAPHGEPAQRHKAAAIARAAGIPPLFAARVLAHLQREGLLRARAGQQGGYTLARSAADISLLEVIEAVEGPLQTRSCVLRDTACGSGGTCVLHDAWRAAQGALRNVLGRTTLAAAIEPAGLAGHPPLDLMTIEQPAPAIDAPSLTLAAAPNGRLHVAHVAAPA